MKLHTKSLTKGRWRSSIAALFAILATTLTSLVVMVVPAQATDGNILPPFTVGQQWAICRGYGFASHTGTSTYGLDLTGSGCDNSASGRNVVAPVGGTVAYYQGSYGNLCINKPGGGSYTLTHIDSSITSGTVVAGQTVGTVAPPNTRGNAGVAHIHFQMWASNGCYGDAGIPFDSAHGARICGAPDLTASGPNANNNGTWSGTSFVGQNCDSGGSSSEPSVQAYQSPTTGAASVYARGVNGDLLTWWTNGGWHGPASLGGVQTDSPALTVDSAGNTAVYMRGAGGNLGTHWTGANGAWNGPVSLGGNFAGTPVANRTASGNSSVYARGVNGDLLTWWTNASGAWNGPASLGGNFTNTPAITATSASTSVYARGINGDLLTWWTGANGLWNGPVSLGGNFIGSPAVTMGPTGGTSVYVRGVGSDLQTYWTNASGAWNGPASLGGVITASPAAYQSASGNASVYARGANGELATYWTNASGSWNGPASLGGSLTGIPAVTVTSGNTAVYGRSSNGELHTWWTGANGAWNGPASLGGAIAP